MPDDQDLTMLARCIELSRSATAKGENPFACVVCHNGEVIAEASTRFQRDGDITGHAEAIAISQAIRRLSTRDLSRCVVYSTVEPCAMCSFIIRETRIRRVVFCLSSPVMGGLSKWNILGDTELSRVLPEVFRRPPEIVSGLLAEEAERVWRDWHPLDWFVLVRRGVIEAAPTPIDQADLTKTPARPERFLSRIFHGLSRVNRRP